MDKPKLTRSLQQGGALKLNSLMSVYTPMDFSTKQGQQYHETFDRPSRSGSSNEAQKLAYKADKDEKDLLADAMPSDSRYITRIKKDIEASTLDLIKKYGSDYINTPEYQQILPKINALSNMQNETKAFYQEYKSKKEQIEKSKDMLAINFQGAFVYDTETKDFDVVGIDKLTDTNSKGDNRYNVQPISTAAGQWFENEKFSNLGGNYKSIALKNIILGTVPSDEIEKDVDNAYKNIGHQYAGEKTVDFEGKKISSLDFRDKSNIENINFVLKTMDSRLTSTAKSAKIASYIPEIIQENINNGIKASTSDIENAAIKKYSEWLLLEASKRLSRDYNITNSAGSSKKDAEDKALQDKDSKEITVSSIHRSFQSKPTTEYKLSSGSVEGDKKTKEGEITLKTSEWSTGSKLMRDEANKIYTDTKEAKYPKLRELSVFYTMKDDSEGGAFKILTDNGLSFGDFDVADNSTIAETGKTETTLLPLERIINDKGQAEYVAAYGLTDKLIKANDEFSETVKGKAFESNGQRMIAFKSWLGKNPDYQDLLSNNIIIKPFVRVPVRMRQPEEGEVSKLVYDMYSQDAYQNTELWLDDKIEETLNYSNTVADTNILANVLVPVSSQWLTSGGGELEGDASKKYLNKQAYIDALNAEYGVTNPSSITENIK